MHDKDAPGYTKPIQIRVGPDIHQWLKEVSAKEDRSVNYVITQMLIEARARRQPQGVQQ